MSVVIDLILVAVIGFCGWRGWRAGLIRGVCGVLALIVSIYVASVVASAYSGEFTGMLKPFASGVVDTIVTEALLGGDGGDDADIVDAATVELPSFVPQTGDARELTVYALKRVGLAETAAERVSESIATEGEVITAGLAARISDRLCAVLAYIAVFIVSFVLLAIIFAVIGNIINLVFSLPGLKLLDSIAGAVFGVAKVLLLIFTLAIALRYFGILTADTVGKTSLLQYVVNVNPVANILGI